MPAVQPYSFVESSHTNVDGEMRNGLNVKSDRGSPVFKVKAIFEEKRDGDFITIIELKFDRIDPTPYSKVPQQ